HTLCLGILMHNCFQYWPSNPDPCLKTPVWNKVSFYHKIPYTQLFSPNWDAAKILPQIHRTSWHGQTDPNPQYILQNLCPYLYSTQAWGYLGPVSKTCAQP